jgi:hypothetical protein
VVQAALLALTNLRDPQDVVHLRRRVVVATPNGAAARAPQPAPEPEPEAAPAEPDEASDATT